MKRFVGSWSGLCAAAALLLLAGGCGNTETAQTEPVGAESKNPPEVKLASGEAPPEHTHGEWWCDAHGIPEHICGKCNSDYHDKQKAAGDWCEMHECLRSQCFKCEPALKERFAAQYRFKYPGKEPPPITDE